MPHITKKKRKTLRIPHINQGKLKVGVPGTVDMVPKSAGAIKRPTDRAMFVMPTHTHTHAHTHTHTHTHNHTHTRPSEIPAKTYTRTHKDIYKTPIYKAHTYKETYMHTCKETYMHTYIDTCKHTYIDTHRDTYQQTYKDTYKDTYKGKDKGTYVDTYKDRLRRFVRQSAHIAPRRPVCFRVIQFQFLYRMCSL